MYLSCVILVQLQLEGATLGILMSYATNEKSERKHLKGPTVYYTVAAEVVSTINLATLYLDKVLSDLPPLMDPEKFAYQIQSLISGEQTCLDQKELLRVSAHRVGCCAVVAPKVILRIRCNLRNQKKTKTLVSCGEAVQVNKEKYLEQSRPVKNLNMYLIAGVFNVI